MADKTNANIGFEKKFRNTYTMENVPWKYNIPERITRDICRSAKKYNVMKVILFGSRARGTHTERSDIDIAVSGGNFDLFYWDIKENAHSLLTFDIVNLDSGVSEGLEKEIKRDGVLIYEKA